MPNRQISNPAAINVLAGGSVNSITFSNRTQRLIVSASIQFQSLFYVLLLFSFALNSVGQKPEDSVNPDSTSPLTLSYRQPAMAWTEAWPIGNGRLGAMVFGGIERERLQLNEDTLWAGGPYDPNNTNTIAALPQVRQLIFNGK